MLPPLRSQDFYNTYLYFDCVEKQLADDNINYVCLKEKKLVIKEYKTKKIYGTRIIDLPDDLVKVITDMKIKFKSIYLVPTPHDKQYKHDTFCRLLNSITGKHCSSQILRKSFVSDEGIKLNKTEKLKVSKIMGHSLSRQVLEYSAYNNS